MNKSLLLLIPVLGLGGCSTTSAVTPRVTAYPTILEQQQAKENKIAALVKAHGSPWVYIGQATTNDKYYLNVETVKKMYTSELVLIEGSNNVGMSEPTQAWWKVVSPDNTYQQIQSSFYCYRNAAKNVSIVQYSATNQYISSPAVTSLYANNVIPNTVFSNLYDLVCSLR